MDSDMPHPECATRPLPALVPRSAHGCQFVAYGDCCIGPPEPGRDHEQHLAAVHAVMHRLQPRPDFVCFLGDMIWGLTPQHGPNCDADALRAEWRRVLSREMRPQADLGSPVYRIAGNHDTFNATSEKVWREVFPDLPANGPPGQEGLSYFTRQGDLLIVALDVYATALGAPTTVFGGRVDYRWVEAVLQDHADAPHKLVLGHTPVFPVNGYQARIWTMSPEFGEPFWDVLTRHRVDAYLCSHVIAFDVRVHGGVLQITTGGAGTSSGPGGCMPAPVEYHHLVQLALDDVGLQAQVLDMEGRRRESFAWPPDSPTGRAWRFRGAGPGTGSSHLLLAGQMPGESFDRVRISLDGWQPRLHVALGDGREIYPRIWTGPVVPVDEPLDLTVVICPEMGPGGVLARLGEQPFSSLHADAADGYTAADWPEQWEMGEGVEVIDA